MRANAHKRKQTLTPPFTAVSYTPLCNPLIVGSSQTWLLKTWLFAFFYAETLFCGLAFALFCAHLRSFACICVFLRPTAFRTTAFRNYPDLLFLACLEKARKTTPKKQGFFLSSEPLKSLGKKGKKRSKKQGNSLQRKKSKEIQKSKERKIREGWNLFLKIILTTPTPHICKKYAPKICAIQWGSVWHKSRLKSRDFYRKYGIRTPKIWHMNPPLLCHMNRFYWGSPRQTKPKKGPKRKVHEFRPFL